MFYSITKEIEYRGRINLIFLIVLLMIEGLALLRSNIEKQTLIAWWIHHTFYEYGSHETQSIFKMSLE